MMKRGYGALSWMLFICLFFAATAFNASADEARKCLYKISTGVSAGTNSLMTQSIIKLDGMEELCEFTGGTGGYDTIFFMLDKKAMVGIVQGDVLHVMSKNEDRVNELIRSLMPLHNNVMHILIKKSGTVVQTQTREKQSWGRDDKIVTREDIIPIKNLQDLKERKVLAFGSATVTLRVINKELELGMDIEDITDYKAGLKAIQNNEAFAMFAMGGTPISWLTYPETDDKDKDPKYNEAVERLADIGLAKMNDADITKCSKAFETKDSQGKLYSQKNISYRDIDSNGISALTVRNELVVRDASEETASFYLKMKETILNNLAKIRNDVKSHSAWDDVNPKAPLAWIPFTAIKTVTEADSASVQPMQQKNDPAPAVEANNKKKK